jgi:hypothetical protein
LRLPYEPGQQFFSNDELQRNWAYEESTVKYLMRRYGQADLGKPLWRMKKHASGFGRLALEDYQAVTSFPMWLGARCFDRKQLTLLHLFNKLRESPIGGGLQEVANSVPEHMAGAPFGLVFPAPGIRRMIVHNGPCDEADGATHVLRRGRIIGAMFVIEPLRQLLDRLGDPDSWGCGSSVQVTEDQ